MAYTTNNFGQDLGDFFGWGSARRQQEFNATEAQKQRDWQTMMSNTAHQREISDLKAAGLNPVLSAMGGSGASTPGGASASNSIGSAQGSNMINAAANLAGALGRNNNDNAKQIATAAAKLITLIK